MARGLFLRPEHLLILTFAGLIALGTAALQVPATHGATRVGLVDALFTATSAVCVTGLTTVDTATAYSRAGQTVILLLIQVGGLGLLTFSALAAEILRMRVSFNSQAALQDMFFQDEARGLWVAALRRILIMTALIEASGALLLLIALRAGGQPRGGVFEAVFHGISAFCNAGFSVYSDNLVGLRDSLLFAGTIMALITLGGLGYPVLFEVAGRVWRRLRRQNPPVRWTLHSRVVLRASVCLTFGGAALLALGGLGDATLSSGGLLLQSLFQSVTARTAGYNTVDLSQAPLPSLLILILLMFVGGSPGSCAGGIKTTSAAVWLARVRARLSGRDGVALAGRRLPADLVRRAALVIAVAVLWNLVGVMVLAISEGARPGVRFEQLVFEQISAFGTVGLSAGLTPTLTTFGKLWIVATMFVGRVGPLTVALSVMVRPRPLFEYPVERVMIG